MQNNLRIISDMERVFWTVLFRIASLVFCSSLGVFLVWLEIDFACREPRTLVVKLICVAFQPLFSRLLRWLMKPKCALYVSSFACSLFVVQSSLVSIALVYPRNTRDFFSLSKASPSGLREMKVFWSPSSKSMLWAKKWTRHIVRIIVQNSIGKKCWVFCMARPGRRPRRLLANRC